MDRTGQVATDYRFKRNDLGFPNKHRTTVELILILSDLLGHLVDIGGDKVRWDNVFELVKPEQRDLRQNPALVWYALCDAIQYK